MMLQKLKYDCLDYVLGKETKSDFLNTMRPTYPSPYYKAAEWINKNTDKDSIVLIFRQERPYYLERKYVFGNISDKHPFVKWCCEVRNKDVFTYF